MTGHTTPDRAALRGWLPGFLALAAIWGSSFLFIKVGIAELHPLHLTLYRVATGAATLLVVLLLLRDRLPREPRIWAHLVVVAAFGVAIPFTLFGYGEQRVESMLAGIWNATTPLFVLPLAVLVFRTERLTVRAAVGLGLGFLGVLVVLGVWEGVGGAHFTGQLMCFGAAACYGVAIPYQKRFIAGSAHSGLSLSAAQLLVATAQLAVVGLLVAGSPPAPTGLSLPVVGSVLALGALGTGLAFVINLRNIRLAGASTAATVTYLVPIFAVLIGALVLGERLNWHQPVGALVVLLGVAVAQGLLGPRRPRRTSVAADGSVAAPPAAGDTPVATTPVGVGASVTARPAGADAAAVPEPEATVC
ncbi:Permease of the drug/metabolite transporter (DMT) superfamily [Micromonospora matsumotoense]|uniref:Permease of the drug/metabolite transporter (DMT) superfamily n=1 Tax=Micromonospora matsumotoense TaxID=121616 RepID=A0A1C4ZI89_9ACTN|nr:DMT family transporter [Micromonospora matsumotoense]SCF32546.1 Permease of the drug/metabolite transporter (DMT) superfamily [Micromonospora matsumotoense]